ncbi:hypothetical protein BDV32DRAFT_118237 [Aspergillus pseudonomiae]|uniref:SnoaL-like domain-containing protein n=1 Tax=Aspergillus pseudonomiae TaxID=1506151 RepID=A0A5N7DHT2_9EURO|nr:uncharacterized protein BDV37DRAFT_281715 [Aspergillus pseudonomiae]KAB8264197.1 hypothetical protein BDV32DRAFT_118237 [Aspergillus pseudonomiae]KAE8405583.1 hypothetical protein BDV37DRAFT_281715 [Aspergillus pseudonomiae]
MTNLNKPSTIERTIAITEIHQVLHRYCILARENAPFHEMKDLFLPDGIFRLPNGTAVAPQDMGNVVQGKPPQMIRHHITSIDVQFVGPRNASTKSLFLAMTHRSRIDHWGYWQDDFQLDEQGNWLIAERMIVVEGQDPAGWYADTYCA